jgi:hypothetical protein
MRIAPFVVAALLALGCSKKNQDGLPPAQDWKGGQMSEAMPSTGGAGANPHAKNPHAADPHEGMNMGGSPHGDQMPPGHPPVAPGGGGPDVTAMGLSAPDPNRKVDPNRRIKGTLKVGAKAKSQVKVGGAVFLIVKKADATGAPSGPPLAVDKVLYADNLKFELTEAHAMVEGTELVGDVVVTARFDQDSDAISKQPGDVSGQTRVKIPADNVVVTLENVLEAPPPK